MSIPCVFKEDLILKTLSTGEYIKESFGYSKRYTSMFLISAAFSFILLFSFFINTLSPMGLGLLIGVIVSPFWLKFRLDRVHYILTNKRVMVFENWLQSNLISIEYSRITNIHIKQSLLNRVCYNMGDVSLESAGNTSLMTFRNVDDPYKLMSTINNLKASSR